MLMSAHIASCRRNEDYQHVSGQPITRMLSDYSRNGHACIGIVVSTRNLYLIVIRPVFLSSVVMA